MGLMPKQLTDEMLNDSELVRGLIKGFHLSSEELNIDIIGMKSMGWNTKLAEERIEWNGQMVEKLTERLNANKAREQSKVSEGLEAEKQICSVCQGTGKV